jgi:uncharacterized protein YkwD
VGLPEVLSVPLLGDAATTFSAEQSASVGGPFERKLRSRAPELRLDPCLERAAAAHFAAPPQLIDRLPLAFTEFAMHWAGCPDPTAAVSVLLSSDDGEQALLDHLVELTRGESYTHIGIARTEAQRPYRVRWLMLFTNRQFSLRPVPTRAEAGTILPLQFRVASRFDRVTVAVTKPGGGIETIDAGLSRGQAVAAVELAREPGRQWIELIGHGKRGPEVLALFPIAVSRPPPKIWVGRTRPDESWIDTVEEAEEFAADMILHDRSRFDLPELERDPRLDAIARLHSSDMATSDYFAHVSPSTGSVADRLVAAGYQATFAAENIALGSRLTEAQESLMKSPGHRASILNPHATHFGVGVAFRHEEYGTVHLLTQVFATRSDTSSYR